MADKARINLGSVAYHGRVIPRGRDSLAAGRCVLPYKQHGTETQSPDPSRCPAVPPSTQTPRATTTRVTFFGLFQLYPHTPQDPLRNTAMPRVTISITAPGTQSDTDLLTLELPPGSTVKDLKGFIEADTNLPSASQSLYLNGQPVSIETQTLEDAGIKDGEMLAVVMRAAPRPNRNLQQPGRPAQPDPEGVRQLVLNDPQQMHKLRQADPELAAAVSDAARWRETYAMRQRQAEESERERQNQIALLNEDPFNVEAQRKIEDIIRQDRVVENLQKAYDENPEVFTRVHMLYVNTEVNGVPVKAFVDSGAQATIMSPDCAERCGIMRLMDVRYAGMARGVGTARILGRVHHAEIKIGGAVMPCAFTVMEGKDVDLLFGLDMLKRYRAKIDLEKNALCFEGQEVPFLHESEIPRSFEEAELNEPTVAGPNGEQIGAKTGAVRPKGTTAGPSNAGAGPSSSSRSAQPQPQSTASSKAPMSAPQNSFPREHTQQLISMFGCTEQEAIQALEMFGGNVEHAASFLIGTFIADPRDQPKFSVVWDKYQDWIFQRRAQLLWKKKKRHDDDEDNDEYGCS
ncbi:dna damage-inducible 1 [Pyrenophora seminiperda CCB06]|uniref:DNA damage-inducible protein 1 n=1 Tax=Pyrenophora seminiperda CCB06 TaxID=1302712 RepID=A0A3M7MGK7_9PLEO|nr:dna damage-inducible 1 [Pyrenophora seminiperda CCB06]